MNDNAEKMAGTSFINIWKHYNDINKNDMEYNLADRTNNFYNDFNFSRKLNKENDNNK